MLGDGRSTLDDFRDTFVIGIPLRTHGAETDDQPVHGSAEIYAGSGLGRVRKFWLCADLEAQRPPTGYASITAGALSDCSELDTVHLVSHGNEKQIGHWPKAADLAVMLRKWGLRIVGKLHLVACLVGKGTYLEELKEACTKEGIAVGTLIGYTESVATTRSWNGRPVEVAGLLDHLLGANWYRVEKRGNL